MAAAQWACIWRICKDQYLAADYKSFPTSSIFHLLELIRKRDKIQLSEKVNTYTTTTQGSKKLSSIWFSKTNSPNSFCEIEERPTVYLHLLLHCNHHHCPTAVRMDGTRWSLISQFNATWSIDSPEAKIEFTFNEILYLALALENLLNRLQNCEILFPRL